MRVLHLIEVNAWVLHLNEVQRAGVTPCNVRVLHLVEV